MPRLKFSIWVVIASLLVLSVHGRGGESQKKSTTTGKEINGVEVDAASDDQLTSGTVTAKEIIPDSEAVAATTNAKGDLKSADSFGLGYYLPIVTPIVKYQYPLFYYHPAAYIHSIGHHGYGGYGFYQHGHGVLH